MCSALIWATPLYVLGLNPLGPQTAQFVMKSSHFDINLLINPHFLIKISNIVHIFINILYFELKSDVLVWWCTSTSGQVRPVRPNLPSFELRRFLFYRPVASLPPRSASLELIIRCVVPSNTRGRRFACPYSYVAVSLVRGILCPYGT